MHVWRLSCTLGLSWEQRGLGRLKGQRSRTQGPFTHCSLNPSGNCSGQRGNVLGVETYCYVAVCSVRRFGAHRGRRGVGAYRGGRPPTARYYYYYYYLLLTVIVVYNLEILHRCLRDSAVKVEHVRLRICSSVDIHESHRVNKTKFLGPR